MKWLFSTERIRFREMEPDDWDWFHRLNNDPEVMKFTGEDPFDTEAETRAFLERYDQYKLYGLGRWTMVRKSDLEVLGWCGLKYMPETQEVDLGYRLFQQFWNRGYATEASLGSLRYGFEVLGLPEIIGRVLKENVASSRVMEKIGMEFSGEGLCEGEESFRYSMKKEEWMGRR